MLLYIIAGFFAGAALMGLVMLTHYLKSRQIPKAVALAHGAFAGSGLLLLVYFAFSNNFHYPQYSLTAFLVAAIAGVYLISRHMKGKSGPLSMILVHGLLAACGLILLLLYIFS